MLDPLSVLEAVFELALISIAIDPGVNSVAISPPLPPLPNVGIPLGSSPYSRTVLEAVGPLSLVNLPIIPLVSTAPLRLAFDIVPLVD